MTCLTKEQRILKEVSAMNLGETFYTSVLAKKMNLGSREIGRHLPRTGLVQKTTNLGKCCRWVRV